MKSRFLVAIVSVLAVAYLGFLVGVKTTDNRIKKSMTKAAESLGYEVTEDELVRLTVQMTYLVNDLDVQGLLNEQDTKEAALMMTVYRLLKEEKIKDALKLSESTMEGYLMRDDEDANEELQQKIRGLLESRPPSKGSDQDGVINSESLRSST